MNAEEFHTLVEDIAHAVLTSPDPGGTAHRLRRHLERERRFLETPASMSVDERAQVSSAGAKLQEAAASKARRRISVQG
jgi:hypothetical protein